MRLLSVLWRPRRSFWQGLAISSVLARWRSAERADTRCRVEKQSRSSAAVRYVRYDLDAATDGYKLVPLAEFCRSMASICHLARGSVRAFEASFVTMEHS